jgi:hypothetical protein
MYEYRYSKGINVCLAPYKSELSVVEGHKKIVQNILCLWVFGNVFLCDEEVKHNSESTTQENRNCTVSYRNAQLLEQIKKRLFTTTEMTAKVEKPNSITSLQRHPSGYLA